MNPTPQGRDPVRGSGLACTTTSPLEGSTLHKLHTPNSSHTAPAIIFTPGICTSQPGHSGRLSSQGSSVYSVLSHWAGQALSGPRVAVLKSQDSWFHRAPLSPQSSWAANPGGAGCRVISKFPSCPEHAKRREGTPTVGEKSSACLFCAGPARD